MFILSLAGLCSRFPPELIIERSSQRQPAQLPVNLTVRLIERHFVQEQEVDKDPMEATGAAAIGKTLR